ncbi:MAG TPA: hypothetical protein VKR06_44935 [Ktedonosporobacter sp.]|nr:hypothetical protein [Ktedonosporobacter sp.]
MSETHVIEQVPHLDSLGNVVPEGYEYYKKLITPGKDLSLPNAYLKWYDIRPPDMEISQEQISECRAFLEAEVAAGRLKIEGQLGFVLLHRAGSFLLLLPSTWRNTNELWESVYVKDLTQSAGYQPMTFESSHRGTFCVWELPAVWHERHAWVRFLSSKRDQEAKLAYLNDRFSGLV